VLTSLPQTALAVEPGRHPMDGAWKLSCGRWLMPDQLVETERRVPAFVSAPRRVTTRTPWWQSGLRRSEVLDAQTGSVRDPRRH
jgi:hypothetical protein